MLIPTARADGQPMTSAQGWAAAQWLDWQKESKSLESIAAYDWSFNFLVLPDGSQSHGGHVCHARTTFSVVGLQPALGRTFMESETRPKAAPVIILGYEFWQRNFNGDRNIIGKTSA